MTSRMPTMLASLQHLASSPRRPDAGTRALRPLPAAAPDPRATIHALEQTVRALQGEVALYQAEYRRKDAELRALQAKHAKWEARRKEYEANQWAFMQDRNPFEGL